MPLPDPTLLAASVAEALTDVHARISRAGGRDVRVIAVTKGFPAAAIRAALEAGCDDIGESYAQELAAKLAELRSGPPGRDPIVHFIGRLQRNKVRGLAALVDRWDSVDRLSVAEMIAAHAPAARVLVQVDTTADTAKGGCPIAAAPELVAACDRLGLLVEGLMTVGPTVGGAQAARPGFRTVRALVDELGLAECSMGMTADLEVAVAEGATEVRVGSALFGSRPRSG